MESVSKKKNGNSQANSLANSLAFDRSIDGSGDGTVEVPIDRPLNLNDLTVYLAIYVALMALLTLSVAIYYLQLPRLAHPLWIALIIAFVKMALVGWYFMDLRKSPTLIRWTCLAGLIWVGLFIALTALDIGFRT